MEKSCGAVVFTIEDGIIKYALVQHVNLHYGFPKGHIEGEETEVQTALREIKEEIGVDVKLYEDFREESYYLLLEKNNEPKLSVFYLASFKNQKIEYQKGELLDGGLYSYDEALKKVSTRKRNIEILKSANDYIINHHLN